jgi:glycosyltransferase involved in cell wall biosynthesis
VRILLSAFQCGPGLGSEPGTGWHWATTLPELGHDVTVLTLADYRGAILAAGPQRANFRFIDLPTPRLSRLSHRWDVYDVYQRWQDAALRHARLTPRDYDVAHHVTWGSLHLGSTLWRLPVPLVYGPVGGGQTAPAKYWRYFGRDWPAEMLRTATTGSLLKLNSTARETIRNSAVTLVCNSATAAASYRLGATDVRFMLADGLPADWLVRNRTRPTGIPVVLWVGRLLPRKTPALAIEAFAKLRRVMPARLIMAGDGPLRRQVHTAVDRLGLSEDVQLLGHVTWDETKLLYDSASVLLFTSLRESFGAPFLEALGRGLPTVAMDLHGIGDADTGPAALKVVLPPSPRDLSGHLASALQTILSDGEWESRSSAAVDWAGKWTWPAKAAIATQIYGDVAEIKANRDLVLPLPDRWRGGH